ncbi:unnamed protein product [Enterobius vermicularis]|uniref:UDENN domain-containing protein n=1 Tax=Enterobius vermicularis TaxID=51028 RepID=A0A0N4UYE2_ENTVE|nr:unnamed protein product [Enterobius vermicularis]
MKCGTGKDSVILHVAVVGFHHKKGCQIEYCYPPLSDDGSVPLLWQNLPTLALPDGAHNVEQDIIYFLLPSLDNPNRTVFGISCYRQIQAEELINRPNEVTRNTVQKSVCVISTLPLFGVLTAKLELITRVYFNERDFEKVEVLSQMYSNLCDLFTVDNIDEGAASMDISTRSLIICFKHRFLTLLKLLLLEKRVSCDLNIFGFRNQGALFHPYLSISYLDVIRSVNTRAYCIGATNALFVQRRDTIDVIVTISESGEGVIDIVNDELKKTLSLTAADLRFADFIIKGVQANISAADWDGSDDWVRLQTRAYLLSLIASARSNLKEVCADFNDSFIAEWKLTNNFRIWSSGDYPDLSSTVPGHPFAGATGVSDVLLKVQHSGIPDGGRRLLTAVTSTGKYFSERGMKVKSSISSWFQGSGTSKTGAS